MTDVGVTTARLDDQINWYDEKSRRAQQMFKMLKAVTIIAAAGVPIVGQLIPHNTIVVSILGAVVIVVESIQQMNQYQQLWITYRATAESLKHEKYLHAAGAGPYGETQNPDRLLAERVEGLVSQEHARWVASKEATANGKKPKE